MSAKPLTVEESEKISSKPSNVVHMFRALHRLALNMELENVYEAEMVSHLTISVAKDGVRILDACVAKMGGLTSGDFQDEFAEEPKENKPC